MSDQFNIGTLASLGDISVKPAEHPEERLVRLKAEERDLRLESYKALIVFTVVVASLVAVGALCMYKIFLDGAATEDARRW